MDEKQPLPISHPPARPEPSRPRRAVMSVFLRAAVLALLILFVLFFPTGIESRSLVAWDPATEQTEDAGAQTAITEQKKVPLEAHIMYVDSVCSAFLGLKTRHENIRCLS